VFLPGLGPGKPWEIADALCVSIAYVSKVLSRRNQTGGLSARPQRCHVPPKLVGLYEVIGAEVKARPDATLAELCRWLEQTHHVTASSALMHGTLRKLGLTHKKRRSMPPNKSVPMLKILGVSHSGPPRHHDPPVNSNQSLRIKSPARFASMS
jgi:transposase